MKPSYEMFEYYLFSPGLHEYNLGKLLKKKNITRASQSYSTFGEATNLDEATDPVEAFGDIDLGEATITESLIDA